MTPEEERRQIAIAYGGSGAAATAALKRVTAEVKDAAAIKKVLTLKAGLANHPASSVETALRRLKRADLGELATALVEQGVRAHGVAFELDPAFVRNYAPQLLRKKTKELCLTQREVENSIDEQVLFEAIPDALFDEIPKLRKKVAFDALVVVAAPITDLPDRLAELAPFLKHLTLSHVDFVEVPEVVFELSNLETLRISALTLARFDSKVTKLKKLKTLELSGKRLKTFPLEICKCASLETLELWGSGFRQLPAELTHLKKLAKLSFQGTPIAKLPDALAALPLEHVDVRGTSKAITARARKLWPNAEVES